MFSVGWQGNLDLDKIAELKPDLILMTGEQEDLYDELSEIAPTVGYQINTDENWDYHETSLKVAEIFDKREWMLGRLFSQRMSKLSLAIKNSCICA